MDDFFNGLFHDYIDFINTKYVSDVQGPTHIIIEPLITLFYSTIKFMSLMGTNIVVDTVNDTDDRFNTFLGLLMDHPILLDRRVAIGQCSCQPLATIYMKKPYIGHLSRNCILYIART